MKVELKQAYRISFPAGAVLDVPDEYGRTLIALNAAKRAPEPAKDEKPQAKRAAKKRG